MVKRGNETHDVELDIGREYGSYAATYPATCPKSEKILGELLDYITEQQQENGSFGDPVHNTFSALALLGSGVRNRNAILVLGILRRSAVGIFYQWRRHRKNLRQSTFKDFHDAMSRFNHRLAFATITARRN